MVSVVVTASVLVAGTTAATPVSAAAHASGQSIAWGSAGFINSLDLEAPVITKPADITTTNDPGQPGAIVNFELPDATDNDFVASISCTPASGQFFDIGDTTVTCTATDATSNTATTDFTITVNDNRRDATQSSTQSFHKIDGQRTSGLSLEYRLDRGSITHPSECVLSALVTNDTDTSIFVRILKGNVKYTWADSKSTNPVSTTVAVEVAPDETATIINVDAGIDTAGVACRANGNMQWRISADEAEANRGGFDRSQRKNINIRPE
ncbi:MAG: HYR domain-containing protein [Actinomycetota bacterium]